MTYLALSHHGGKRENLYLFSYMFVIVLGKLSQLIR
jgi:hypothetical protein